jgi:sec-independent protein translocase protein TatB
MFGLGFTEILLIIVVAILFLGPDKLPEAMVNIAKFMKSVKKAIGDAKSSLDEEMKIAELKEEALGYKKKLDDATSELQGFKNIGINPMEEIDEAISGAKKSLADIDSTTSTKGTATQVESKQEPITFSKKKTKKSSKSATKSGDGKEDKA